MDDEKYSGYSERCEQAENPPAAETLSLAARHRFFKLPNDAALSLICLAKTANATKTKTIPPPNNARAAVQSFRPHQSEMLHTLFAALFARYLQ
ncbi:hypothetical protein [Kingella potus]|uniref:hypothetical protein n=1 Tax=Kingella potus TaxID=265175 RepID=UPI0011C064B3|nr:hypothetical protein [Kingella potus]UOO99978.1 hypothetical protein LVJ84_08080 [Kingella potus]